MSYNEAQGPSKVGAVTERLIILRETAAKLVESSGKLEDSLKRVLSPVPTPPSPEEAKSAPVPLVAELDTIVSMLEKAARTLDRIHNGLEL